MSAVLRDLQNTDYDRFLYWLWEWSQACRSWEGPRGLRAGGDGHLPDWSIEVQRIESALVALGLDDAEQLRAIKDVYLGNLNNTAAAIARRWTTRQFERYLGAALKRAFELWLEMQGADS